MVKNRNWRSQRHRAVSVTVLLGLLSLLLSSIGCPSSVAAEGPRLRFEKTTYDFGQVSAGQKREERLIFTNAGTQPLKIADVYPEPAMVGA